MSDFDARKVDALKLALEALEEVSHTRGQRCKEYLARPDHIPDAGKMAQPEKEPVATVIEELEHDGQGWCSKVRWLYNPVPAGETLFWEQPK